MKRTLLIFLALLSWQIVTAEVVTERQARHRAAEFFAAAEVKTKAPTTRPEDFKLVGTFPEVTTKASPTSAPALYIFDRPTGGYAIVSGDDVARPVLGYSLGGQFPITDMPDNLRGMLQWYADIIAFAREQHWAAAPMPASSGLDPANTIQLQTAQWDQGKPFNDLVEEIDGEKPPIGCTATAIAIIMRYHKWPKKGNGTLPSYDYTRDERQFHIEGFSLGHEYDWDKMPENYCEYSAEESAQIARLLYDVAVMCEMSFYPGESAASPELGARRLTEYFGYDRRVRSFKRGEVLSDQEWESKVIDEINAGRPVLYVGYTTGGGGHAFLIDGYNGRYFSVNYGWGGHHNKFFYGHDYSGPFRFFYTLTPIEGHEEDLLVFNRSQSLTTHIMPDAGGEPTPMIYRSYGSLLPNDFELGKQFNIRYTINNSSLVGSFTTDFRFALCDSNGAVKEVISSEERIELKANFSVSNGQYCIITKPLADGDRILLFMKDPDSGEWIPVSPQPRQTVIAFTNRTLSELIEIGYDEEPRYPDSRHPDKKRSVYFKVYKDLIWTLRGNTSNRLLYNLGNYNLEYSSDSISYRTIWSNPDDPQCDTLLSEIWLPTGNYTLNLWNPLTDERMTINLEL